MGSPIYRLYLDEDANLIEKVRLVAEVKFTEEKRESPPSFMSFEDSPYSIFAENLNSISITHKVIQVITGSMWEAEEKLKEFYSSYEKRKLKDFKHKLTSFQKESIPPPSISQSQINEVFCFLAQNNINYIHRPIINILLKALAQARSAQLIEKDKIIILSSKSKVFSKINDVIDKKNKENAAQNLSRFAKASIRILPSGLASITIPGSEIAFGGTKIVKRELMIRPDGSLELSRRYKLKKDQRNTSTYKIFEKNIIQSTTINADKVIYPKVVYYTPKKKIEYLAKDCLMDSFALLKSYAIEDYSKDMQRLHSMSIEDQTKTLLDIMLGTSIAVWQLHSQQLLHNDIKPENILISYESGRFSPWLCDLDFVCKESEGAGPMRKCGSELYVRREAKTKNIQSDLYALAKTFHMEMIDGKKQLSFEYPFERLQKQAKTQGNKKLSEKLRYLKEAIQHLSSDMQGNSIDKKNNSIKSLDNVILILTNLKNKFLDDTITANTFSNLKLQLLFAKQQKKHKRSQSL